CTARSRRRRRNQRHPHMIATTHRLDSPSDSHGTNVRHSRARASRVACAHRVFLGGRLRRRRPSHPNPFVTPMTPARFPTAGRRVGVLVLSLWRVVRLARAVPAFPGAEGFGATAAGGRGGEVYVVTNLSEGGPGSFRDAVSQPNRYVVFAVGGIIPVSSRIVVASNLSIAGQAAPGEGRTLYGNGLSFSNANDTVTRYLRIPMGAGGDS